MIDAEAVCKHPDLYFGELADTNCVWTVTLSNGEKIFQDDGRPGVEESSAWIRLGRYCRNNSLSIVKMILSFRSNEILVGENARGYYFCKGLSALLFSNESNDLYMAGTLNDEGSLIVNRWKVPELFSEGSESRNPAVAGDCLITNE